MIYGVGAANQVGQIVGELGCQKAFIVTDGGIVRSGLLDQIKPKLEAEGLTVEVYQRDEAEPTEAQVHEGAQELKGFGADVILGFGGGGSMDAAKGIKVMATNPGSILDYEGFGKAEGSDIRLVAIPTTAGTGSEAGPGAVITDSERKRKIGVISPHISPDVSIVDPLLTLTVPPKLTAYTGLDALAQSIGAYLVNTGQPISDALAIHAVELIFGSLGRAVAKGDDLQARTNVAYGSMIGAIGMHRSGCTGEHYLAETVGGYYKLPHGLTVAIFLPYIMEFNRPAAPERFVRLAQAMGERTDGFTLRDASRRAVTAVADLLQDLEIPSLKEIGVREKDLEQLTDRNMSHWCVVNEVNPRPLTREAILELYRRAYQGELFA
jgi:alcohol dehydrogenase class IV